MATTFSTTELDFNAIKDGLKTYFKKQSEFSDYDFEASGLSNILDVLAYNTHYNALIGNFALNEAYLSSAQLRSSVISLAQTLGYNIRSRTASKGIVTLSLNLSSAATKPSTVSLPSGTSFTASVDGVSYTFQTREEYFATDDGNGIYTFKNSDDSSELPIYEGKSKTKTFIVQEDEERQVFVIPDTTLDSEQVFVKVYDTFTSTSFESYVDITNVINIDKDSTFYKIYETPNGYYELSFGDGVSTGRKPTAGQKVEIEYLSTVGPDANSAKSFTPSSQISVLGTNYDLSVTVVASSAAGALRESVEAIRQNAPLAFASQNRLVTADDYKAKIKEKYSSSLDDVVAWGGEDNDPPKFGFVYVGLLFKDGITAESQTSIKNEITSDLNENLGVLSIDIDYVDPVKTYLELETQFDFNPNLTSATANTVESQVTAEVNDYVDNNLKTFEGIFRKSNLLADIDELSPGILSTKISVKMQQQLTPITAATSENNSKKTNYTLNYPAAIQSPQASTYSITSTSFVYSGVTAKVKNKLNSNKLQIVDANNTPLSDNVGSYNSQSGKISLVGFDPGVISSGDTFIKFSAVPASDDVIKPLRNYYFDIDNSLSFAVANIDRGETSVNL
jgi:hypothetical protein